MAVRPTLGMYGYPNSGDDAYTTPLTISPASGGIGYGPELFAQYSLAVADGQVLALINWEVQAGYSGSTLNAFSGILYDLQISFDHTNWLSAASASQAGATGRTWRWHCCTQWPIVPGGTGAGNFWARMVIYAGNFGSGEDIVAQGTWKRSIMMIY